MKQHLSVRGLVIAGVALSVLVLATDAQAQLFGRRRRKETAADRNKRKLHKIIIPELKFRQAAVEDVIDYLATVSREHDPEGKGVNIVLNLNAGKDKPANRRGNENPFAVPAEGEEDQTRDTSLPPITFSAFEIPLIDALTVVTQTAGLKYRYQGTIVMVVPENAPDGEIVVRMYDVSPDVETKIEAMQKDINKGSRFDRDVWGLNKK